MKKALVLAISIVMVFCFFGCVNSQTETKIYDADITADTLNSKLQFGEPLEKSTADALFSIYGIDSSLCSKAAFYAGSGATADEIAVFNCINSDAAKTVKESVTARLDYLRDGYSSYGPDQIPKIDSAAVIIEGNSIIMCICDNPQDVLSIVESVGK